jgi:hypothetical protein
MGNVYDSGKTAPVFFNIRYWMEGSGQLHVPDASSPGRVRVTNWTVVWMSPRDGLDPVTKRKYVRRDFCSTHAPSHPASEWSDSIARKHSGETLRCPPLLCNVKLFFLPNIVNLTLDFSYVFKNKILMLENGGEVGNITDWATRLTLTRHVGSNNARLSFLQNGKEPNKLNSEDENLHLNFLNKAQRNINFTAVPPAVCLFSHPVSFIHSCASVAWRIRRWALWIYSSLPSV